MDQAASAQQPAPPAVAAAVQHQLIVLSDCDLIIANVEDHKCFVVVVTAVDSAVVVLIILRVQDYGLSWIYNIIRICILEDIIVHCIFYVFLM